MSSSGAEGSPKAEKLPMGEERGWTHRKDHTAMRQRDPNALFTAYYRDHQKIVPEGEWDALVEALKTPLPATLWINDTDPLAPAVSAYFASMPEVMKPIPWYPLQGMAWQLNVDKKSFRKAPELADLRQYLIRQTAMGLTSRQEAVSMIPPFLLDIQATDRCLDMCASPGSKTAQMLAIMGRLKKQQPPSSDVAAKLPFDYLTAGCVVANEKDEKRANMLVYQVRRLRQLFPFAAFVNHDARYLPDLVDADGSTVIKYDKVLCDVVCSGDGTIRKAPNMISSWRPMEALKLQRLQIEIALRGCHVLRVGGRMVYSTCSMNPIENEAVVLQLLRRTNGAMRLVDARSLLPGLKCDPGMPTWAVVNNKGEVANAPGEHNMHEACFPPTPAEAAELHLERCMRFLPHHCDGGCFFIAVLEKVGEYEQPPLQDAKDFVPRKAPRSEGAAGASAADKAPADAAAEEPKERVPPRYLPAFDEAKDFLSGFFGAQGFPVDHLYSRAAFGEEVIKKTQGTTCMLVADDVRRIVTPKTRLIVVAAGLRVLAVESLTKTWRVAHEAGFVVEKFVEASPRVIQATREDVAQMCGPGAEGNGVTIEKIESPELRAVAESLPLGCGIMRVATGQQAQPTVPVAFMRARNRLQLLVDKDDLDDLRCRLDIGPPSAAVCAEAGVS